MKRLTIDKFILICIIFWGLIGFAVSNSNAATDVSFEWTPNAESTVEGYKLVMDSGDNTVQDITGITSSTTTFTVIDDKNCHSFALFAYSVDDASLLSDFAIWCPKKHPKPVKPVRFLSL